MEAAAAENDADMNKPLVCAATEATQCEETETCVQGPAGLFDLPVMFRIDFGSKIAESVREGGERRKSRIDRVESRGNTIILQGADETTAWIATVQTSTGRMTIAAAREGHAFVVFGSCARL
jgi:hypothetical protein